MSVLIQSNTQNVTRLQNPTRTRVNNTNYTIGTVLGSGSTHLVNENADSIKVWTFNATNSVASDRVERCTIDNTLSTHGLEINTPSGVNFEGTGGPRVLVLPGESRDFIIAKDGSTLKITPVGPVVYEFTLTSTDVTDSNGFNLSDVPAPYSQLFETPTSGGVDRLVFRPNVAGDLEVQFEANPSWGGTNGVYPEHTNLQFRLDDNGNTSTHTVPTSLLHITATSNIGGFSYRFFKPGLTGNQWVNPAITGLAASITVIDIQFNFKIILKPA